MGGPGGYGVGHRMKLSQTRAIIDAIHDGSLLKADYVTTPVFGLQAPTSCNNVPADVLQPEKQVRACFCPPRTGAGLTDSLPLVTPVAP